MRSVATGCERDQLADLAEATAASAAELLTEARLGHATPAAAMRYQHAAKGRDQAIAAAMSRLVEGGYEYVNSTWPHRGGLSWPHRRGCG